MEMSEKDKALFENIVKEYRKYREGHSTKTWCFGSINLLLEEYYGKKDDFYKN